MPASTATNAARAVPAATRGAAANGDDAAAKALRRRNQRTNLVFRQKAAEIGNPLPHERTINGAIKTVGKKQYAVRLFEDMNTGERGSYEVYGEVVNIPRAQRTKRTAGDMLDEDGEVADQDGAIIADMFEDLEEEEEEAARVAAAAKQKKKKAAAAAAAAAAASNKKQKKAPLRRAAAAPATGGEDVNQDAAADVSTSSSTSTRRRSTRATAASLGRKQPVIREDEAEQHTTQDMDENEHYNFRRTTRASSDGLNNLADIMGQFDIKSEAESECTRVFSRDSSLAEPVASTSRS